MRLHKAAGVLLIFYVMLTASCQFFESDDKFTKKVIREEKPVTKVDVSIDTSNAFNSFFMDSSIVHGYLALENLSDTMLNRIKSFYNSRNYQFAWFSKEGLPEHTISFWNMLKNYLNYSKDSTVFNKPLFAKMDAMLQKDTVRIKNDSAFQKMEIQLTKCFYLYADHAYAYEPNFDMKSLEWYIPKKKLTLEAMVEAVLQKKGQYADTYAPANPQYLRLRNRLQKYHDIKLNGGWPEVKSTVEEMKLGYKNSAVLSLKKRLKAEGFYFGEDSTLTNEYDSVLANAVNTMKLTYGYKPDGKAGKTWLKEVNIPVEERIQQVLINMERMRWIPLQTNDTGRAIMVNIPEYKLHVYEGGKPAWDMNVVVGKEGNNTTIFTGRLSTVVFSPYWNVPPSIVKKEMHGNPSARYLARNHMEIVKGRVRQKPGPWNSLGLVKFLFPNSYNIYFHDSPAKSLFNKDKRSYSHGCIRLKEPAKLAEYLLNDTAKYNKKNVDSLMHTYKEKYVRVPKPVPVLITYFTAWVNDSSVLNFREDIYGHDAVLAKKMFLNSVGTSYSKQKAIKDSIQKVKDLAKLKEQRKKDSLARVEKLKEREAAKQNKGAATIKQETADEKKKANSLQ